MAVAYLAKGERNLGLYILAAILLTLVPAPLLMRWLVDLDIRRRSHGFKPSDHFRISVHRIKVAIMVVALYVAYQYAWPQIVIGAFNLKWPT